MVSLKDGHLAAETHCYDFSIYYNWDEYDPEYNPVYESEYDPECNPEYRVVSVDFTVTVN